LLPPRIRASFGFIGFCPSMNGTSMRWALPPDWLFLPWPSDKGVNYRKPAPGMLLAAIDQAWLNGGEASWEQVVMVGDRPEDRNAAIAAEIDFCWAAEFIKGGLK